MKHLKTKGIEVTVYEPAMKETKFFHSKVSNCLVEFKAQCDIILANRMVLEIEDVTGKVYTRDLFGNN